MLSNKNHDLSPRSKRLDHVATASHPHCGDWLRAIPVGQIENSIDNDSLKNGIAIRLGLKVCQPARRGLPHNGICQSSSCVRGGYTVET